MAINNHKATSTGLSPFFLTYGYHMDPVSIAKTPPLKLQANPPVRAKRHIYESTVWSNQLGIGNSSDYPRLSIRVGKPLKVSRTKLPGQW